MSVALAWLLQCSPNVGSGVLLGDAAYNLETMRQRRLPAIVWSPDAMVQSWKRFERIERETGVELCCTHESNFADVPISPHAYWS